MRRWRIRRRETCGARLYIGHGYRDAIRRAGWCAISYAHQRRSMKRLYLLAYAPAAHTAARDVRTARLYNGRGDRLRRYATRVGAMFAGRMPCMRQINIKFLLESLH